MPNFQFNPNTTRWQAQNALALAMASQLAYENAAAIDATIKTWGFTRSDFIASPPGVEWDSQVFVASNADAVIVAFRGTQPDDLKDWITDADIVMAHSVVGPVHFGFWAALQSVWGPLEQAIVSHQVLIVTQNVNGWNQIFLPSNEVVRGPQWAPDGRALLLDKKTGAGSNLFYQPLDGSKPTQLTHFDTEPLWISAYALSPDGKQIAITRARVNNSDVVTRVPTRQMGYSHVGTSFTFDAGGAVHADTHFWNKFLERFKGDVNAFLRGKLALFDDHAIANYVRNAENNLDQDPF